MWSRTLCAVAVTASAIVAGAMEYHVGPGQPLAAIGEVPWESLAAGDQVAIHWRDTPYAEKWVICRQGTEGAPIVVRGVPGPEGQLPVVTGNGAVTRQALNYWGEERGVIKVGGASVPADTLPSHIVIEGLEIRSARPAYSFTDDAGSSASYAANAASIYVEKADHITIRDCILRDSGNGLFVGAFYGDTRDILIAGNWIVDNGIEGSVYQHNTYTAAIGITYEHNRFGPLRGTAGGNNLKDRSAGLVVRYNWIEGGNRQLDLVDAEDSEVLVGHPDYHTTLVYGNVLIEPDQAGNSQIVHYGGDSDTVADYRKGTLHFYNNTVVSTRADNTTLLRLSTNDESADVRNNIVYVTAEGSRLAILDAAGTASLGYNWLPSGWRDSHGTLLGTIVDELSNLEGSLPGFRLDDLQDFTLQEGSVCENSAGPLATAIPADHQPRFQYWRHQREVVRPADGALDIGAFEGDVIFGDGFESGDPRQWSAAAP